MDSSQPSPPAGDSPPASGMWDQWSRARILGLAVLLMGGNLLIQVAVYLGGGGLFLPVLAGAVAGVLLPASFLLRSHGFDWRQDFLLDHPALPTLTGCALLALAALVPTSLLAELSLRLHPADPRWAGYFTEHMPTSLGGLLLAFFTVVLVAPLAEEMVFRGLVHRLASGMWGPLAGAVLSALVFGIVHGEPWFLFGLIGVGLVLAFVFEATGSVTACWVTHALHNGVSFWMMLKEPNTIPAPSVLTWRDAGLGGLSLVGLLVVGRWLWTRHR